MDEQRLERALRAGPPFATHYVARPLALVEPAPAARWSAARLAILLALVALLLAATLIGALAGGLFRTSVAASAVVIRDPGFERTYTVSVVHADGREEQIFPQGSGAPVWIDDFAWSVGGDQLAFTAAVRGARFDTESLFVVRSDGTGLRQLVKSLGTLACPRSAAANMRWAPDGRTIAVCAGDTDTNGRVRTNLLAVDVASGASKLLATNRAAGNGTSEFFGPFRWSPNGEWLAYRLRQSGNAIWVVRRDGSDGHKLAVPAVAPPPDGANVISGFAWSPESDAIAFGDRQAAAGIIEIVRLDGGRSSIALTFREPDTAALEVLAWYGHDELIYLAGGGRVVATTTIDGAAGETLLAWDAMENPPWLAPGGGIEWSRAPWVMPDGRTVHWWESGESGPCLMEAQGGNDARAQLCIDTRSTSAGGAYVEAIGEHAQW